MWVLPNHLNIANGLKFLDVFIASFQMAEIGLYEVGLYRVFNSTSDKLYHLSILDSCLTAVKTFFDYNFSPDSPFPTSFPYFRWIFMGYVLILAAKLSVHKVDGWDTKHVHDVLDCAQVVERVISKFEEVLKRRVPHGENEIFERYLQHMRLVRNHGNAAARARFNDMSQRPQEYGHILDNGQHILSDFMDPQLGAEDFLIDADDSFWRTLLDEGNGDLSMMEE